jgi:O-antigen ligase
MPRMTPVVRWIVSLGLITAIATMSLTWVPLARPGGFDLLLPYGVAIGLGGLLLLTPGTIGHAARNLPPFTVLWLVAYLAYLVVLQFSLSGGDTRGMIIRQLFFMICGAVFALGIVAVQADGRTLRRGGLFAVLGFVGLSEVLARQLGLSWVTVIQTLVATGNLEFVFYQFLKEMFELVLPAGEEAKASDKNTISVALLTALILFRAGWHRPGPDLAGQIVTLATLAILIVLNTRSVLVVAVVILPLAAWFGLVRGGIRDPGRFILTTVIFVATSLAGVVLVTMAAGGEQVMGGRFAFDDDSTANRFGQYAWALGRIESSPWAGSGLADFKGQLVHNLFLGAWMHAGFLAFVLVVIAYLAMLAGWLSFVLRVARPGGYWVLPLRAEWVAILPVLPLFRVWIAGDAGHPSFVEWTALFGFSALVLVNRAARSKNLRNSAQPPVRTGGLTVPG